MFFLVSKLFPRQIILPIRRTIKIIITNWINVLAITFALLATGTISSSIQDEITFVEALLGTAYALFLYGMMYWVTFLAAIVILDIILFSIANRPRYTYHKLAIEWLLISSPLIYGSIMHGQWIFLLAAIAFAAGQYARRRPILKILHKA